MQTPKPLNVKWHCVFARINISGTFFEGSKEEPWHFWQATQPRVLQRSAQGRLLRWKWFLRWRHLFFFFYKRTCNKDDHNPTTSHVCKVCALPLSRLLLSWGAVRETLYCWDWRWCKKKKHLGVLLKPISMWVSWYTVLMSHIVLCQTSIISLCAKSGGGEGRVVSLSRDGVSFF